MRKILLLLFIFGFGMATFAQQRALLPIEKRNKMYRLSAFGIKDACDHIYKMGVIGALYYFVMKHYLEKGSDSLKIGKSMPVIFDGVS